MRVPLRQAGPILQRGERHDAVWNSTHFLPHAAWLRTDRVSSRTTSEVAHREVSKIDKSAFTDAELQNIMGADTGDLEVDFDGQRMDPTCTGVD